MPNIQAVREHAGQHKDGADRGHLGAGGDDWIQRDSGGVTIDGAVPCPYNCDIKYNLSDDEKLSFL